MSGLYEKGRTGASCCQTGARLKNVRGDVEFYFPHADKHPFLGGYYGLGNWPVEFFKILCPPDSFFFLMKLMGIYQAYLIKKNQDAKI